MLPVAVEFAIHGFLYCDSGYIAYELFNITCSLHFLVPKTWVIPARPVNQISISKSGWLFVSFNASQQTHAFEKNTSLGCLYLQRNYVSKPGQHVTKALFQKHSSRKWRIRIPPSCKRMPLSLGIKNAVSRMSLNSWTGLPKWSSSVFGTQARPQPDVPCFVALEFLNKFGTFSASN